MAKLTKAKFLLPLLPLIFFTLFCCLSGCGGSKDTTTTTETGTETGTTPTTPTTPATPDLSSLTLSISPSFVASGSSADITATLTDASGALVPGAVVTFAASNSLVVFAPPSGTALTNSSGIAHITLNQAGTVAGATSITASAPLTTAGTTTTITSAPAGVAVGGALVTLGTLTVTPASISAYGTSSVSIAVSPATVPIQVAFTSTCVGLGMATLTSPVTTILGTATSTYKDNGCASGSDIITATVAGSGSTTATITVAIPAANNMQFVSATPTSIGIKGSTLPQSSQVEFQVVDNTNHGVAGVLVDFSLLPVSIPGNVTLSALQATSDTNGNVTVSVNSGTVPTPVWVVATLHTNPAISSQSDKLTITTGLPTQNFFSLSVSTFNIEGWSHDGQTSTLTIIASDRMGNPIPDGTVINFITPVSGQISPPVCTMSSGTCTVTYKSSGSRPANGRVSLLAYTVGEKSFVDTNGNNSYDAGETFYDLGDLYVDTNENGQYETGEQSFVSPNSGSSACLIQPAGTPLTGDYDTVHGGNIPSKDGTCTGSWGISYVRRSTVITLSGSSGIISTIPPTSPITVTMGPTCHNEFDFTLKDINGNAMPVGTTVTVNAVTNNVYYTPNGGTSSQAAVSIIYGSPVADTYGPGGTSFTMLVDAGSGCPGTAAPPPAVVYPQGTVDIVVKSPLGVGRAFTVTVN